MIHVRMYTKEKGMMELTRKEWSELDVSLVTYYRTDGPAFIYYRENGNIAVEHYLINNKHHRTDGPAIIAYDERGQVAHVNYCINDKNYTREDYWEEISRWNNKANILKLTGE